MIPAKEIMVLALPVATFNQLPLGYGRGELRSHGPHGIYG